MHCFYVRQIVAKCVRGTPISTLTSGLSPPTHRPSLPPLRPLPPLPPPPPPAAAAATAPASLLLPGASCPPLPPPPPFLLLLVDCCLPSPLPLLPPLPPLTPLPPLPALSCRPPSGGHRHDRRCRKRCRCDPRRSTSRHR